MKYKLAAILGIMLAFMSIAVACHYSCYGVVTTQVPAPTDPTVVAGTQITIHPADSAATYQWWVQDDGHSGTVLNIPFTINSDKGITFTVPASECTHGISVSYTATIDHPQISSSTTPVVLTCITSACKKYYVTCPSVTCPNVPNYCSGGSPATVPSLPTPGTGVTYKWDYKLSTETAWIDAGTGVSPNIPWTTLGDSSSDKTYNMKMVLSVGGVAVQTCNDNFDVYKQIVPTIL